MIPMIPNTEHLPGIGPNLSGADAAAERFRSNAGRKPRKLTPEEQDARERFLRWHQTGSLG